jgi:ribosomal protein S19
MTRVRLILPFEMVMFDATEIYNQQNASTMEVRLGLMGVTLGLFNPNREISPLYLC